MPRPNPHALRRFLFLGNFGLLALVLALGGSLVAAPTEARSAVRGAEFGANSHSAWERARREGLRWSPTMPVSDREFDETFGRYAGRASPHYPFVGPLPSSEAPPGDPPPRSKAPGDLGALGSIAMLIVGQRTPTVSFSFASEPRVMVHVRPGEFFRRSPHETPRFRLTRVEAPEPRLFHVHYDVIREGSVERSAYLVHDSRLRPGPRGPFRPEPHPDARPASQPKVGPTPAWEPRPLMPTIHVDPRSARRRVVALDRATHAWGRKAGVGTFLTRIKTTPALDPTTKAPLGIRITGFGAELPADRFDVQRGDILVSLAGQKVTSRAGLLAIARSLDPTRLIPLVIDRRGTLFSYRIDARDPLTRRSIRYFDVPESK